MSRRTYRLFYLFVEKTIYQSRSSYSTSGTNDALEFAKQRKHFEYGMSALRKQWAENHRAVAAQKAAEALQRVENQKKIRLNRLAEGAEARERRAIQLEEQRAKAEEERVRLRLLFRNGLHCVFFKVFWADCDVHRYLINSLLLIFNYRIKLNSCDCGVSK
jgi:hypothetical protein